MTLKSFIYRKTNYLGLFSGVHPEGSAQQMLWVKIRDFLDFLVNLECMMFDFQLYHIQTNLISNEREKTELSKDVHMYLYWVIIEKYIMV